MSRFEIGFVDLQTASLLEVIEAIDISDAFPDQMRVRIPVYSVGSASEHISICEDLLDASYVMELLAAQAREATFDSSRQEVAPYTHGFLLTASGCTPEFFQVLKQACIHFGGDDADVHEKFESYFAGYTDLMDAYSQSLEDRTFAFPSIIDDYFANLINGAYYTYAGSDWVERDLARCPERLLGFHRSAYSKQFAHPAYVSIDSWILDNRIELDVFFARTEQKFRQDEFLNGNVFMVNSTGLVKAGSILAYFPIDHLVQARVCSQLVHEETHHRFASQMAPAFSFSLTGEVIRDILTSRGMATHRSPRECLVHESGEIIVFRESAWSHILYDTRILNLSEIKSLNENLGNLFADVSSLIGLSEVPNYAWETLDDESFELLCYDLIYAHPNFNHETIRKMGKSRSRDGGRDILVWTNKVLAEPPKKYIFQCKLVSDGRSLSKGRLTDIGDMLDQYAAEGFGVMTSAVIDSTLYDAMDGICSKRSILQKHFSRFEIERFLVRHPSIRNKYFPN